MRTQQRHARIPRYRRILWPTDLSPLAKAALPHVLALASHPGAELITLHVLATPATYGYPGIVWLPWDQVEKANREAAGRALDRLEKTIKRDRPSLRLRRVVTMGVAFEQIVKAARRFKCDLVVLATHGRTGLKHVLLGSVAENVVRRAPCPVLAVRPRGFGARG